MVTDMRCFPHFMGLSLREKVMTFAVSKYVNITIRYKKVDIYFSVHVRFDGLLFR